GEGGEWGGGWVGGAGIGGCNLHEDVFGCGLCVFDKDVEVSIVVEPPRVDKLELGIMLSTPAILLHEPLIWKRLLRVLVKHFQVGMSGGGVKIVVHLFDVLAMIRLAVG